MLSPSLMLFSYFWFKMFQKNNNFYLCCLYTVVVIPPWYPCPLLVVTLKKDICVQSPGCIPDPQLDGEFFLATLRLFVLDPIVSRNPLSRGIIYDQNIKVPNHFHCNWSLESWIHILGLLEELDLHSCNAWCTFVKLCQSTFLEFDFTFPCPCCWRHIFWKSQ